MNTVMNYESIFERYGGIMRTCELTREGNILSDTSKSNRTRKSRENQVWLLSVSG